MNNKTRKLKKNKKIKQKGGYIVPPTNPYFMATAALIGGLYVLGQAQSSKTDAEPTAAPSQPQGQSGGRKFRRTRSKRQTGGTNNNMNIVLASHDGNTEIVEKLLKNGVGVDERYRGFTALIKASQQGHIEILKMLLENGADVNARIQGWRDSTALIQASHEGHTEIVRMLLENGADVNATAPTGYHEATALMEASNNGDTEIVKMLLENGANVNAKDEDGRTALDTAKIVAPWRTHRPNTEVNSEVVNLLTNAEKVRDNKQKAMEQVEGSVRKVPSLHALTLKELNTTELNNLNKYNIFPTRKKLGGKRRTKKSKKFKESKKTKKKYMRKTRRRNKRKKGTRRRKQKGGDRYIWDMVVDLTTMFCVRLPPTIAPKYNDIHDLKMKIINKVRTTHDMVDFEGGLKEIFALFIDLDENDNNLIDNQGIFEPGLKEHLIDILKEMCERQEADCSNQQIQEILGH